MRYAVPLVIAASAAVPAATLAQCTPQWDRTISNPGTTTGYVGAMTIYQGDLVASGSFTNMAGVADTKYIARYNIAGNTWTPFLIGLGDAPSNSFGTSFAHMGGDLYVGGFFADAAGVADTKSIARWDGTQFHSLGTGWAFNSVNSVWSMTASDFLGSGRVFFGGFFETLNGQPAGCVGMWDGTSVTPIVTSMPTLVQGASSINPLVTAMVVHDDGMGGGRQLYIGGRFNNVDGQTILNVARWNGTTWSPVGTNLGNTIVTAEVDAMVVWNGDLYVGGTNLRVNGTLQQVAKWDGSTWTAVGQNPTGRVWSLEVFDDGSGEKLYAGGTPLALGRIFRLEGNTWVTVDGGADAQVVKLMKHNNTLYMGGSFANVNGQTANRIIARTSCLAPACGTSDFNGDGDFGTDADIEAFFACLAGSCCPTCFSGGSDFNMDGDVGTDADIESFFRVLAGGNC
jgi:trimeric autotransporter adhesin